MKKIFFEIQGIEFIYDSYEQIFLSTLYSVQSSSNNFYFAIAWLYSLYANRFSLEFNTLSTLARAPRDFSNDTYSKGILFSL